MSFLESSITLKRKPLGNDQENHEPPRKKQLKNNGFVTMRDHAKLVSKLAVADELNQLYQSTWMREYQSNFSFFIFF